LFDLVCRTIPLEAVTYCLPSGATQKEWLPAFSKLVVQAYGLLGWLEKEPLFWTWTQKEVQLKSLELQALLMQILLENTRPYPTEPLKPQETDESTPSTMEQSKPPEGNSDPSAASQVTITEDELRETNEQATVATEPAHTAAMENSEPSPCTSDISVTRLTVPEAEPLEYVKIPRKERPSHRIIHSHDTDARRGTKNRFTVITGYKTQNLCTPSGVILGTKAIPGSEHDGEAMVGMIRTVQSFFGITPKAVLGDTAYGHGEQRVELKQCNVTVIAPVAPPSNPTGLYAHDRFIYDTNVHRATKRLKNVISLPRKANSTILEARIARVVLSDLNVPRTRKAGPYFTLNTMMNMKQPKPSTKVSKVKLSNSNDTT